MVPRRTIRPQGRAPEFETTTMMNLTRYQLQHENRTFAGTGGVSQLNRVLGFIPAFRDRQSGRIELSRFADGRLAPLHLLEGLPAEWTESSGTADRPRTLKASIVAGFCRDGRFYTRAEAAALCCG